MGKPSSGSKGGEEGDRSRRKGKKKTRLRKDFFSVVMYLIKLKDYFALSQ